MYQHCEKKTTLGQCTQVLGDLSHNQIFSKNGVKERTESQDHTNNSIQD